MKELLKGAFQTISGILIWIVMMIVVVFIGLVFIKGGAFVADWALPYLNIAASIVLAIDLLIFLPLAAFQKTRGAAGIGLYISSWVFGLDLWILSFLLCLTIWGPVAVIIGVFMGGVGVFPIALLATALNGLWVLFFSLLFDIFLAYGSRVLGIYLIEKADSATMVNAPLAENAHTEA